MIQFITASHNQDILNNNLIKSRCIQINGVTIMSGYKNVSLAYNSARKTEDIICYVHHDVFLPDAFYNQLVNMISSLPEDWGVLGVAGVRLQQPGNVKKAHGYIADRGKIWGTFENLPHEVDTLDELLLITRGDFMFDENLPQDFYGADICMQAKIRNEKCYAINAYCEHNSGRSVGGRTEAFYKAQEYFKNKWKDNLPIVTTCALLT